MALNKSLLRGALSIQRCALPRAAVRPATAASSVSVSAIAHRTRASSTAPAPAAKPSGILSSILHGSQAAKEEGELQVQQHSKLIGRNKYVHEMITHRVKPDQVEAYKAAAEKYYTGIAADPQLNIKLTGSWETVVGELDTFVHILEYENYDGFDKASQLLRSHPTLPGILRNSILPAVHSRHSQIMSEFAFWPSSPPRKAGGIFEMRSYALQPGTLLEWETAWRRGIEARKRYVEPAGAWFSQVGQLHEVHHLWQYPDMATRKATREQAWNVGGWSETVQQTVKLAKTMKCAILMPCSWSPLQ